MLTNTKSLLLGGFILSFLVFSFSQHSQKLSWKDAFSRQVQKEMILLKVKIEANEQILLSVRSLFNSSSKVERSEFKTFVDPLIQNAGFIKALEWIPRVQHSQRKSYEEAARLDGNSDFEFKSLDKAGELITSPTSQEYFPVFYLEPLNGNEPALGFDLASNINRKKTLSSSRDSGNPLATEKIRLVQESEDQTSILVFVPVYHGVLIPDNLKKRREMHKGFVLGVYHVGEMFEAIFQPKLEAGLSLAIYQGGSVEEKDRIYGKILSKAPLQIEKNLKFSGQEWKVYWQGSNDFSKEIVGFEPYLFAVSIFALFFILAIIYQVNDTRNRFQNILESTIDGIITMDTQFNIQSFNPAAEQIFGYTSEEVLKKNISSLMAESFNSESDVYRQNYIDTGEKKIFASVRESTGLRKDGSKFPLELSISEINSTGYHLLVGIARDISVQKSLQIRLKEQSQTDEMTGLNNRRYIDETLKKEWDRSSRAKEPISIIYIDIDNFKNYNDIYGHPKGDECLKKVSAAIKETLGRPGDIVARYGGEEFLALLTGTDLNGASYVAEEVRKKIENLGIKHEGSSVASIVTISLGIATTSDYQINTLNDLIEKADKALYQAKEGGRNRIASIEF